MALGFSGCEEPPYVHPDFLQEMVLGTNIPGQTGPDAFLHVEPGGSLPIVFGFQGLYMVVLAARIPDLPGVPVKGNFTLEMDGALVNDSKYNKSRAFEVGGDGYQYFFDIWIIVDDLTSYLGKEGTIHVELFTSDEAYRGEQSIDVIFVSEDSPQTPEETTP